MAHEWADKELVQMQHARRLQKYWKDIRIRVIVRVLVHSGEFNTAGKASGPATLLSVCIHHQTTARIYVSDSARPL